MSETLSIHEAQKLVLHSQKLPPTRQKGKAITATLAAIEHLGYIQIDTISVVQRAHHHTLWNRNPRYTLEHIDQLIADKKVFEYWSHAAAYLPMRDYRFSLPRKLALARGEQSHWYKRDEKLMRLVSKRIEAEGPLMARDFEGKVSKSKPGDWKSKPAKQALDTLFMQGDLMISSREKFHKVYDLTERVLPQGPDNIIDTSEPTPDEYIRFIISQYLSANGIGQAAEIAYLLKGIKPKITAMLQEMESNGELLKVNVGNRHSEKNYYALANSLELLNKPLARSKLKILSPFDNLLIQRKRMKDLFDFDYLIECYVPAAKRKYGYFSLPILWDGKLVARIDCKADRAKSMLDIRHLALEPKFKDKDRFYDALEKELEEFLEFQGCGEYAVLRTS